MKTTRTFSMLGKILCLSLLVSSCKSDPLEEQTKPFPEAELVSASFVGRVVDENNQPVNEATVTLGTQTTSTNANGAFEFNNVQADKYAAYIKVEKQGYFLGSRTLAIEANTKKNIQIALLPKQQVGTFASSGGGTVTVPNTGVSIQFASNAVINTATNTAYNGTVAVAAHFIDPTAANLASTMPGELRGIDHNNRETGLQTFSMLAVELTGSNSEKLNLAAGKEATLTFFIPVALRNQAPSTIPLWYFDETKGLWREEGVATKQGDNYIGTVKHFSFWSCNAPYQLTNFEATFKNENGNPLSNLKIVLTSTDAAANLMGYAYTDAAGKVEGSIPANKELHLVAYDYLQRELYSRVFTSGTNPMSLGTIGISTAALPRLTLSGTVKNCSATGVSNGYVTIALDGQHYQTVLNTDGSFTTTVERQSSTATQAIVTGFDVTANKQSSPVTLTVTTGTADAVQLTACQTVTVSFSGKAIAYSGNPVNNGYVQIQIGAQTFSAPVNSNGEFAVTVIKNGLQQADAILTAYDAAANKQGFPAIIPIVAGNYSDIELAAWGTESSEYVTYTVNKKQSTFTIAEYSVYGESTGSATTIYAAMPGNNHNEFSLQLPLTGIGQHSHTSVNVEGSYATTGNSAVSGTITEYGAVRSFIGGHFSGTIQSVEDDQYYPIYGAFKVKRMF